MKKVNIIGICAILLIIAITVTTILTVIIITNKPKTKAIEPQVQLVSREVVSVYPYISRKTNQFGKATDEDIVYYIVWKSSTGELRIWDEYDPSSCYYDLKFGEENRLVFNPNDEYDGNTCLYLTEETLKECINNKLN